MDQAEHDPTGRSAHEPGSKLDAGKPRPALVLGGFARALSAVADVGTYGARKYTDNGWRTVPDGIERYSEAMLRHWLQEQRGELCDLETKLLHAAHMAWNALARLELMLSGADKERVAKAETAMGEWCYDRPPTLRDADVYCTVWVWNCEANAPGRIDYMAAGMLGIAWVNGDARTPTQPPARG